MRSFKNEIMKWIGLSDILGLLKFIGLFLAYFSSRTLNFQVSYWVKNNKILITFFQVNWRNFFYFNSLKPSIVQSWRIIKVSHYSPFSSLLASPIKKRLLLQTTLTEIFHLRSLKKFTIALLNDRATKQKAVAAQA